MPAVVDQREVHPGAVTLAEPREGFDYRVREPHRSAADRGARETLADYFADANVAPPRTREGAVERMREGFSAKHHLAVDRLTDLAPAARRRIPCWTVPLSAGTCDDELLSWSHVSSSVWYPSAPAG